MKFTVNVKRMITTNLSEVDISEDKINEDFGSVDNLNGSTAAANDLDTYEIGVSFAF